MMVGTISLYLTVGFAITLVVILALRNVSVEAKFIIIAAVLTFLGFLKIRIYLLLFTSMSLFAFIGVALIWAIIATRRLRVERTLADDAMVGENFPVKYRISSSSLFPVYHTRIWDYAGKVRSDGNTERLEFSDPGYISFLSIGRGNASEGTMHVIPEARGRVKLGPIAIEGGDPFGIFMLRRWIRATDEFLVLPGWIRLPSLPAMFTRIGSREQINQVNREGSSHEFLGIRAWSEGDSLRRVHWPLTAKHNQLIVRQFQKEVEEELVIIVDADKRADIGFGAENAFEYMVTLAISMVHTANDQGRPWSLVIQGRERRTFSHQNRDSVTTVQYVLAEILSDREDDIELHIADIAKEHRSVAFVLITPRTDYGPSAALAGVNTVIDLAAASLVIKFDTSTFATGIDSGMEILKRKRSSRVRQPEETVSASYGSTPVTELLFRRGNKIDEIFNSAGII